MKLYRYKIPGKREYSESLNRLRRAAAQEGLTGYVHGRRASDYEERYARALDNARLSFRFSVLVLPPTQVPGHENEVDFIVEEMWPIEIDGMFVHKSAEQKAKDLLRDAILNEYLGKQGYMPIQRIPGNEIETPEMAARDVRERF